MHLKVALSRTLLVAMESFLNRSVQNLHLAAFTIDKISVPQRLRDAGFERIRFLNAKSGLNAKSEINHLSRTILKTSFKNQKTFDVSSMGASLRNHVDRHAFYRY